MRGLATVSAYLVLSPRRRTEALGEVRAVLPDRVDIDSTVRLSVARRVAKAEERGERRCTASA